MLKTLSLTRTESKLLVSVEQATLNILCMLKKQHFRKTCLISKADTLEQVRRRLIKRQNTYFTIYEAIDFRCRYTKRAITTASTNTTNIAMMTIAVLCLLMAPPKTQIQNIFTISVHILYKTKSTKIR